MPENKKNYRQNPPLMMSLLPIFCFLAIVGYVIYSKGAEAAQGISWYLLLCVTVVALFISKVIYARKWKYIFIGIRMSAKQILPTISILLLIGTVSATWMMSGTVPVLIDYGLQIMNPNFFLVIACVVCAGVSVMSGSSWTTIATIGVAFMGIGDVLGYNAGWVAGAVISGAYFGDKVSPLSDTTVLASATADVPLFKHIRYMMITTVPSMSVALLVFFVVGLTTDVYPASESVEMVEYLRKSFNITPWVLLVPVITGVLIAMRVSTFNTLILSSILGLVGMFVFQPQIVDSIFGEPVDSFAKSFMVSCDLLLTNTQVETGNVVLNDLVATGGVEGMMPTVCLVLAAMLFGGVMIGSGMITSITQALTRKISSRKSVVNSTVCGGLLFNASTGDQYLAILLSCNVFRRLYKRNGLEKRLLSRTVEDSVSVTSVLMPWNSCGVAQSMVLGIPTLVYLPYCVFNYVSPIMSMIIAAIGYKIVQRNKVK